ncbi:unnamed protein product [Sphagnum balticum]
MMARILNGLDAIQNILSYSTNPTFTSGSNQIPNIAYLSAQLQLILEQAQAYAETLIAQGGSSGRPLSFATFTLNNYDNPTQGYYNAATTFNKQTASNGGNFAFQNQTQNIQIRNYLSDWSTATDLISYAFIGSFLYVQLTDGTNYRVYEYSASNVSAGGTLCTGITFGTQPGVTMACDGTYLYFNHNSGNSANDYEIDKYSASTGVLTFVSTTNLGSTAGVAVVFLVDSSGNYYAFNTSNVVNQYNSSGTLQQTTAAYPILPKVLNWQDAIYGVSTNDDQFVLLEIVGTNDSFVAGNNTQQKAANTLTLGMPLGTSDIVGGTVDELFRGALTQTIPNFQTLKNGAVQIDTGKIFVVYEDSVSGNMMGVICNPVAPGMTINPGTPQILVASGSFSSGSESICKIATGEVAIVYTSSTSIECLICTVTGTVITIGTPVAAYTDSGNVGNPRVCLVTTGTILVSSNGSTHSNYIVATVFGTVPTFGTKQTDATNFKIASGYELIQMSSGIVLQAGASVSTDLGARVLSVSGTVVSFGTLVNDTTASNTYARGNAVSISSTLAAFAMPATNGNVGYFAFVQISGTTVSHIIHDEADTSGLGGCNVLLNNGYIYGCLNVNDPSSDGYYAVTRYLYTGGASFSNNGVASQNTGFGNELVLCDNFFIGFINATTYAFSGMATMSMLGYCERGVTGGNTTLVLIGGIDSNQTNLIPGQEYYVTGPNQLSPIDRIDAVDPNVVPYYAGKAISFNSIAYSV